MLPGIARAIRLWLWEGGGRGGGTRCARARPCFLEVNKMTRKHSTMMPYLAVDHTYSSPLLSAVQRHLGRPRGRSSRRPSPPRLSGGRTDTQLPYELNRRSASLPRPPPTSHALLVFPDWVASSHGACDAAVTSHPQIYHLFLLLFVGK